MTNYDTEFSDHPSAKERLKVIKEKIQQQPYESVKNDDLSDIFQNLKDKAKNKKYFIPLHIDF